MLLIIFIPKIIFADARDDKIKQLETSIDQYTQQIRAKENEAQSLANQISIFELQIKQTQAEIDVTNLTIAQLSSAIKQKENSITLKEKEIEKQNEILAQYLRQTARSDNGSLLEFLLKNQRFSDFFSDLNHLSNVQSQIQDTLVTIKGLKEKLTQEKDDLE
ncbi:MAG: hypothetical protein V1732_06225, partial [Patescibacteria group bacterium]